jgi:uncharacterized membrane protein YfcA
MIFSTLVFVVAIVAGAIAAISGFGIGSLLTPIFAAHHGVKLAVAIVSVPHLVGTAARFFSLKGKVDRHIFWNFGILSAVGGLIGALLHSFATSPALSIVFGALLVFAGMSGLTGLAQRMRFGRKSAWFAGGLSGLFGGLVGNQGGIRSAALLGFDVSKEAFVATATAIALIVDGARMPVYLATQAHEVFSAWEELVLGIAGVLVGTFWGVQWLRRIPENAFRRFVSIVITALGLYMLIRGAKG